MGRAPLEQAGPGSAGHRRAACGAVAMDALGLHEEPAGDDGLLGEMEFARTMFNPKERRRGTD